MPTEILDLLLLNIDGKPALVLLGPDGEDRLRPKCRHCMGVGRRSSSVDMGGKDLSRECDYCRGRGWLPTPNGMDILDAASLMWKPHFFYTWLSGILVLEVRHQSYRGANGWIGNHRIDAADLTQEQAWCDVLKQALETEGAK